MAVHCSNMEYEIDVWDIEYPWQTGKGWLARTYQAKEQYHFRPLAVGSRGL